MSAASFALVAAATCGLPQSVRPNAFRRNALTAAAAAATSAALGDTGLLLPPSAAAAEDATITTSNMPAFLPSRCQEEIAINGAYVNPCMRDPTRTFQWPAPIGSVTIEQGDIGPSQTGETLWNAAVLMADHMATDMGRNYFEGKTVIELGCGTALPSIVATRCGAKQVVATDIAPEVLDRARRNVARNQPPSSSSSSSAAVECKRLVWGVSTDEEAQRLEGSFDVVIASDVLWILGSWKPLALAAKSLLKPDGDFLLAETGHDSLPLPAALAGFRAVAESSGLVLDDSRSQVLPLQVDGFDAQLIVAHRRRGA